MSHILRIDTSPKQTGSITRDLTDQVIARISADTVTTRDLATPLPQLDEAWVTASRTPPVDRTPAHRAALELSDALIAELRAADTLVIGLPTYNFGPPAALKAWIDQICRPGETFQYTANGAEGLLEGKRAIVAMASGGTKAGSEIDFATPYIRFVLGFVGITDVTLVTADTLMVDAEAALKTAHDQIEGLAA